MRVHRRFVFASLVVALALSALACGQSPSAPSGQPVLATSGSIPSTPTVTVASSGTPTVDVPYVATPENGQATVYVVYTGGCGSTVRTGAGAYSITFDQAPVYHGTAALFKGDRPWDCRGEIPTTHPMFLDKKDF